nr:toxin CfTX-A-like [Hydra vulgaris]
MKADDNKYIDGAKGVVDIAQSVVDNLDKFTSGDVLDISSGAIGLIGTIGSVVAGPAGPLIAGICGLVTSILPLFGGNKGPSMADVVYNVIKDALEDFKDESIYDGIISSADKIRLQLTSLNAIAKTNGGILSDSEKSYLTQMDFENAGLEALATLQNQIQRYKSANEDKKSSRLAMYCYYYSMISLQKATMLTLKCSLLRLNNMDGVCAAVEACLNEDLPKNGREVLDFISDIPENRDSWWLLYRCLHTELSAQQRAILSQYRNYVKCAPMNGQLCQIYNIYQSEYMYLANGDFAYDSDRRRVFTWREKNKVDEQGLFRIIGSYDNCQIYGVYYGEYLYAADYPSSDGDRRNVFTWRPGNAVNQGDWQIQNETIRNLKQNEYMYAADYEPYDDSRRYVYTWKPGNPVTQGDWRIIPLSFEQDDLKNAKN